MKTGILAVLTAAALIMSGTAAAAPAQKTYRASAPAQKLSLTKSPRAATVMGKSNKQVESDTTTYVIAFFVVLAIGLGIYVATDTESEGRTSL